MSNQPPYPGQPEPDGHGSPDEQTRHAAGGWSAPYGGAPQQHNPYEQPPGNPYGPTQGPYGQPPQQPHPQQGPYGQPQNPYAQQPAPYTQPQYQQPYPPPHPQQYGGQYGGGGGGRKKWLVPLLVVLVLALVGGGVAAAILFTQSDESSSSVADLSAGDCLSSSDIADGNADIDDIQTSECTVDHDAEVFATYELTSEQVEDFDIDATGSQCVAELEEAGVTLDDLTGDGNEVRPLVASDNPDEGDAVICFIRNSDGEKLSEQIVE